MRSPAPEGLLAYYVTSSEPIRKFAETSTAQHRRSPLAGVPCAARILSNTRNLNVGLLYDTKIGLLPQGAVIPDMQKVYSGMIAPLLHMERTNLANQAMGLLSQLESAGPGALEMAMARINLAANNPGECGNSVEEGPRRMPPNSPLLADREELWGRLLRIGATTEEAIHHYIAACRCRPAATDSTAPAGRIKRPETGMEGSGALDGNSIRKWNRRLQDTSWPCLGDYFMAGYRTRQCPGLSKTLSRRTNTHFLQN